jgi:hypothetical protein
MGVRYGTSQGNDYEWNDSKDGGRELVGWQGLADILRLRIRSIGIERTASEMSKSWKEAVQEFPQDCPI